MFSENTLLLYNQDLQLGPYFVNRQWWPRLPIKISYKIIMVAQIPRVVFNFQEFTVDLKSDPDLELEEKLDVTLNLHSI